MELAPSTFQVLKFHEIGRQRCPSCLSSLFYSWEMMKPSHDCTNIDHWVSLNLDIYVPGCLIIQITFLQQRQVYLRNVWPHKRPRHIQNYFSCLGKSFFPCFSRSWIQLWQEKLLVLTSEELEGWMILTLFAITADPKSDSWQFRIRPYPTKHFFGSLEIPSIAKMIFLEPRYCTAPNLRVEICWGRIQASA